MIDLRELIEETEIVNVIPSASLAASANTGVWIPLTEYRRVTFVVNLGAVTDVVAFKLQEATDASGTGAQDITGKVGASTATDDNHPAAISVDGAELSSGFTYVTMVVTPDTAAALASVTGFLYRGHVDPADNDDLIFAVKAGSQ